MRKQFPTADAGVLAEINITPFTDVLLVLLIIFMLLASLLTPPGFERRFSSPGKSSPQTLQHQVSVTIDRAGHFNVDGTGTTAQGLYGVMARIGARFPQARVSLYANVHAPYGSALRVLDAAKLAGLHDVAFATL